LNLFNSDSDLGLQLSIAWIVPKDTLLPMLVKLLARLALVTFTSLATEALHACPAWAMNIQLPLLLNRV
jgi:hypothetical protein